MVPIRAETTRRCPFGARASTLRMKCTRQRCQVERKTLLAAALSPSWASEITAQKAGPEWLSLRRADLEPEHLTPAVAVTPQFIGG